MLDNKPFWEYNIWSVKVAHSQQNIPKEGQIMRRIFLLSIIAGALILNGCVFVPREGYYSRPSVISCPECYTPPINYSRPEGVWYPWGSIGNGSSNRNQHQSNERSYEKQDGHTKAQEKALARERAKRNRK
jgi:hypothetical protein